MSIASISKLRRAPVRFNRVLNRMRDLANAKALNAMLIDTCVIPPLNEGDTGYVYLVGYEKFVKIGWTEAFRRRFTALQNGIPETLLIYAIISAQPEFEEILHHRFMDERAKNEWFFLKGELERWIKGGCGGS